jgi:hypothetical protein
MARTQGNDAKEDQEGRTRESTEKGGLGKGRVWSEVGCAAELRVVSGSFRRCDYSRRHDQISCRWAVGRWSESRKERSLLTEDVRKASSFFSWVMSFTRVLPEVVVV